jgi:hypothetical protein
MIVGAGSSDTSIKISQNTERSVVDSNLGRDTVILIEIMRAFTQSLQVAGMRDGFLPDPFLFMPFDTIASHDCYRWESLGSHGMSRIPRREGMKAETIFHAPCWG